MSDSTSHPPSTLSAPPTSAPTEPLDPFTPRQPGDELSTAAGAFLDHLRLERGMAANTRRAYAADLALWLNFCQAENRLRFEQLDYPFLRRYLGLLHEQRQSRATIARKTASLRAFMRFCVTRGWLTESPAALLRNPRGKRPLPLFLEPQDALKLMQAPSPTTVEGKRDRAILEVLLASGMRVGELVALNLKDIDFSEEGNGAVRIVGKGRRERIAFIGAFGMAALKDYLAARASRPIRDPDAVFLNHLGRRLTDRGVRRLFEGYAKAVGLDARVSPHTLRHTFATTMLNRGTSLRDVQEFLGHADLSTTQIYTHVSTKRLDEQHQQFHPRP